ncbi:MAG: 4-hydroxythreonine-4-phosphate dehydrogenase PdxA [Gammaproteobacteria bacterium]|nr:4-hydroxythreonine-4-phosphate dehydrogenase PdxA [Gammaproteobacteria bacterium]
MTTDEKLLITVGEPSGIGPDIVLKLFYSSTKLSSNTVAIGDIDLLRQRGDQLGIALDIVEYDGAASKPGTLPVIHLPLTTSCSPGILNQANSSSVIGSINLAVDLCLSREFQAMVTAPVHKAIINASGIPFTGHTEWISDRCGAELPVMMLASNNMKVCLATTHLPLKEVSNAITKERLASIINIMHRDIASLYGIPSPTIGVCGLNPHAGEGGHLGSEEIDTIEPIVEELRERGINLIGPLPADTAFTNKYLKSMDAILAMYHDQGLPVIKHSDFGDVVNVTLGIPIIRTSVDHGTALDIAGTGTASSTSLASAVHLARKFAINQNRDQT